LLRSEVYLCKDELFEKEGGKPHVRPDFRVFALDYRYVTGPMSFGYTYNFPDFSSTTSAAVNPLSLHRGPRCDSDGDFCRGDWIFPSEVTIIFAGTLGGPNGERSAGVKVRNG
jgi:hypothetical protein